MNIYYLVLGGYNISSHSKYTSRFKIQFTSFLCNFWIFTSLSAISASLLLRARLSLTVHCLLPLKFVSVSSSFFSRLRSCLFFFIFDCFSFTLSFAAVCPCLHFWMSWKGWKRERWKSRERWVGCRKAHPGNPSVCPFAYSLIICAQALSFF